MDWAVISPHSNSVALYTSALSCRLHKSYSCIFGRCLDVLRGQFYLAGVTSFFSCILVGVYEIKITVGQQYPMVPPSMQFVTKVFHPNVQFNVSRCAQHNATRRPVLLCLLPRSTYCRHLCSMAPTFTTVHALVVTLLLSPF